MWLSLVASLLFSSRALAYVVPPSAFPFNESQDLTLPNTAGSTKNSSLTSWELASSNLTTHKAYPQPQSFTSFETTTEFYGYGR